MKDRDKHIVTLINEGKDSLALSKIYDSCFSKIKNHVRRNAGNLQDAEDLFQDGITILYRYIKTGKYDSNYEIDGFLFIICKNLWVNRVKKDQKIDYTEEIPKNGSQSWEFSDALISHEREKSIKSVFSALGDRCKELLTLVIYFDSTMKEVAEKMAFSNEDSAKTQHYKCKQKLVELVGGNMAFKNVLKDGI